MRLESTYILFPIFSLYIQNCAFCVRVSYVRCKHCVLRLKKSTWPIDSSRNWFFASILLNYAICDNPNRMCGRPEQRIIFFRIFGSDRFRFYTALRHNTFGRRRRVDRCPAAETRQCRIDRRE